MFKTTALVAVSLLALSASASAAVYETAATTPGNQSWAGTLGLDFTALTPVLVTSLGAFDSTRTGITTDIKVGIFTAGGTLVMPAINFNGTANPGGDAFVFQNVSPFVLAAGNYQLGAWGYNGTNQNYNSYGSPSSINFDTLGGKLVATGTRYAAAGGALATIVDVGVTRYGAGSFTATDVPPGTPLPPPPPPPTQSAGVYNGLSGITANQQWTGTLGLDFSTSKWIKITSIGAFDSTKSGISTDINVAIFNSLGQQVSSSFNLNGVANPNGDAFVFTSIPTLTLAPGSYQLASWGYNSTNANYNSYGNASDVGFRSLGGTLTALGTRYSAAGTGGVFATIADAGETRYGAGSFIASVPEPHTWAMLVVGFGLVGFGMRRKTAVAARSRPFTARLGY